MSKELNPKTYRNVMGIIQDLSRRSPSEYEGMSAGINILAKITNILPLILVALMGLCFVEEYSIATLLLGAVFFAVMKFSNNINLLCTVKKIYESENLAVIRHQSAADKEEDSELESEIRKLVNSYIKKKQKDTQSLLDKVS